MDLGHLRQVDLVMTLRITEAVLVPWRRAASDFDQVGHGSVPVHFEIDADATVEGRVR